MEQLMTDSSTVSTARRSVRTSGRWIGPVGQPLMSWVTEPLECEVGVGVVIVPPLGYEYWSSHRTLRTLAERLAAQGCRVLRFDFDGTGDSSGDQWDSSRLAAWKSDIAYASQALSEWGISRLVLIGLRMGATFSLMEGNDVGADAVVAWAPLVRGRQYVKELRLLGLPVPDVPEIPERAGSIVVAGSVFAAETLAALSAIDLAAIQDPPAPKVLVIDREKKPASSALLDRLDGLGVEKDHIVRGGTEMMLDQPTEYATVPSDIIDEICRWVRPGPIATGTVTVAPPRTRAKIGWRGGVVEEEVVRLGESGLVGLHTRSCGSSRATVLWLNSGSEHHVGPGRAWVEYARDLALTGFSSVRMDFSGWGESPDLDHAPGRPYDQHGISEVVGAVKALRELGHHRVVLAGLCAGAWIALKAALDVAVDGVIAINPQMYWQPGDPKEADIVNETRVRRLPEIRRNRRFGSIGLWSLMDAIGLRHPAAVWLKKLERLPTPIVTFFVEQDDGLEFLQDRTGRAWRRAQRHGPIKCTTVADIDHSMRRHWHRRTMIEAIGGWLDTTMPADGH
jgi:pimeloyl-ACP methyl ester carboxylesterase